MLVSFNTSILGCRFDEECRGHVADDLKGRGIHLYPNTSPTRWLLSDFFL